MSVLKALLANWQRKAISLLAAILIWVARTNAENPVERYTAEVPLSVNISAEYRVDLGGVETVTATLRGPRRSLASVRDGSVRVTAALRLPDPLVEGTHTGHIQIRNLPSQVSLDSCEPTLLNYTLTRMARKTVRVAVRLTGAAPPGIYLGDLIYQPQEVEVQGPDELVDAVDHVRTLVRREDAVNNLTVDSPVRPMDASGGTINDPSLVVVPPRVTVSVPAEDRMSKTLPVSVSQIGEPAQGFRVGEIGVAPETVEVRGTPEALAACESIETAPLNLTGCTESFETTLALRVPPDISPRNVSSVTVHVVIAPEDRG